MKIRARIAHRVAFTLTELMIVLALIALLAGLALPNLAKARDTGRLNSIYDNLRCIEGAKDQWALDNNKATGTPVSGTTILKDYFRLGGIKDVMNETYVPNPIGTNAEADLPAGVGVGPFAPGSIIAAP
jgi:prepilin-type N-terminal cleavage/methylation domain-containing protein